MEHRGMDRFYAGLPSHRRRRNVRTNEYEGVTDYPMPLDKCGYCPRILIPPKDGRGGRGIGSSWVFRVRETSV